MTMVTVVTMKIGALKHRHHRHPSSPRAGCTVSVHPAMLCEDVAKRDTIAAEDTPQWRTLCEEALSKGALLYMAMYVRPFSSLRSGQGRGPCAAVRLTQFQGGMVIAKTKEQLQRECAELEQRIRQHQNQLQRLEQRTKHIAKGERQKRAHRLITRGAAVESVAPAVCGMTEHEFYELVERIFALPDVQALLPKGGE